MSISEIANPPTPVPDLLPGYALGNWRLKEFAEAEAAFESQHMEKSARAASRLPQAEGKMLMAATAAYIGTGQMSYGTPAFGAQLFKLTQLPFLLYLSLRVEKADMTLPATETLVTPENRGKLQFALLKKLGYIREGSEPPKDQAGPAGPSSGVTSMPPSESAG